MTATTALIWMPLLLPATVAVVAALRRDDRWTRTSEVVVAAVVLACGLGLMVVVRADRPVVTAGGLLRADALSAYMLTAVGAVALVALWGGLPRQGSRAEPDGRFAALVAVFLAAMSLAVLADDLGVLWVAVEATTIATAFLVGHQGGRAALEAAWKYVVLGSVGVAIAFLGIVLLYAASHAAGQATLSWTTLSAGTIALDPDLTRVAVALTALGFATKAGLAPMHSWLPDAHSQAPARVSGLMSGVLLSVAFYAILRVRSVSDAALGPGLMRGLLVTAGLLSLAVAAALVVAQRDYKRLLAYSSIEHMGLMALGAAAGGPLATAAVLLHILGHGLVKATMFVVAGRILAAEGTTRVADVRDLLARRPDLAVPFLVGTAALLGLPPSVLFLTEVGIVLAGWQAGLGWAMAVALVLLLAVFGGIGRHVLAMTVGGTTAVGPTPGGAGVPRSVPKMAEPSPGGAGGPRSDPTATLPSPSAPSAGPRLPVALSLGLAAALTFAAWPLAAVLTDAAAALGGAS